MKGGGRSKGSEKAEGEAGVARAQAALPEAEAGGGRVARRGGIAGKVLVPPCLRLALGGCLGVV